MRALRAILVVFLVVIVAVFAFGWWTGRANYGIPRTVDTPRATTGTIDTAKARERGAQVGEKAAQAAAAIQETVAEAAITSKIKAKMALDDHVRSRGIDVTTSGTIVTLSGAVRSNVERDRALTLARETAGVTRVVDQLVVRP
jgi:osmotically-inducible protein OsmY